MSSDWARERAVALLRDLDTIGSAYSLVDRGTRPVATALRAARIEERKAIAALLREPDEAMVEAVVRAGDHHFDYIGEDAAKEVCRAIADLIDPEHTRTEGE